MELSIGVRTWTMTPALHAPSALMDPEESWGHGQGREAAGRLSPHLPQRVFITSYWEVSELSSTAVLAIDGAFEGPLGTGLLGCGWLTPTPKEEPLPKELPGLADPVPIPVGKWGVSCSSALDGR